MTVCVGRALPGPDFYENSPHPAMGIPRRITLPHSCYFLQAAVGVVTRALRPVLPDTVPPTLYRLIEQCWSRDVAERPAFSELTQTLQRMLEEEREAADGGSRQLTYSSAMAGRPGPVTPCASCAFSEQMPAAVDTVVHTTFHDEHVRPSQQRRMAGSSSNILASSLAAEDGHESDGSCAPLRGLSA